MDEPNPYESPTFDEPPQKTASPQPNGRLCAGAKATLCCLGIHAFAAIRFLFFSPTISGFDELVAASMVFSTLFGVGFSISAIRHAGWANRVLGACALFWFGFYILLAIAES